MGWSDFIVFVKPDVELVARMLIEQHGADVRVLVAMKMDELSDAGHADSLVFWRRIKHAVDAELTGRRLH